MAGTQKKMPTKAELETQYGEITALYDLAEALLSTTESPLVEDPEAHLGAIEELVARVGETTDVLSEEFINVAENKSGYGGRGKARVEMALRKAYVAMEDYRKRANAGSKKIKAALKNIAEPIVKKIERQLQRAVAIFIEMIDLSLSLIMNPLQLQELKRREARVALFLHEQASKGHT